MVKAASKLPVKVEQKMSEPGSAVQTWRPLESLRREIDRLFYDFDRDSPFRGRRFDIEPFRMQELGWASAPAADFIEKDNAYEITAELPGLDEKNIEVKLSNSGLMIKGEKSEEKEEKKKEYHLRERHFGSFERYFEIPKGVDTSKIEATFKKGVLTVTLPKTPEARKAEKKIPVKPA